MAAAVAGAKVAIASSNTFVCSASMFEKASPSGECLRKAGCAGAHAVLELLPRVLDADAGEQHHRGARRERARRSRSASPSGVSAKRPVRLLVEHAHAREQAQHAPQRRRVRVGRAGERAARRAARPRAGRRCRASRRGGARATRSGRPPSDRERAGGRPGACSWDSLRVDARALAARTKIASLGASTRAVCQTPRGTTSRAPRSDTCARRRRPHEVHRPESWTRARRRRDGAPSSSSPR